MIIERNRPENSFFGRFMSYLGRFTSKMVFPDKNNVKYLQAIKISKEGEGREKYDGSYDYYIVACHSYDCMDSVGAAGAGDTGT